MENTNQDLNFNMLAEETLYKLANATMAKDYKSLIEWLVDYRFLLSGSIALDIIDNRCQELTALLTSGLKKYKRLLLWSQFDEALSYQEANLKEPLRQFIDNHRQVFQRLPDLTHSWEKVLGSRTITAESDLKELADTFAAVIKELGALKLHDLYMQQALSYEQKLTDHVFLLEELLVVLVSEHDRKVRETQQRFLKFIELHQQQVKTLEEDLSAVSEQLCQLKVDVRLAAADKTKLQAAFQVKEQEIKQLRLQESKRLKSVELAAAKIVGAFANLRELIAALEKQLDAFKSRAAYVQSLTRIGKQIPELESNLDELFAVFATDVKKVQESFVLFDSGTQNKIIGTIEEQGTINRIIFSDSATTNEEFQLCNLKNEPPEANDPPETTDSLTSLSNIQLNLDTLRPLRKER